ncbi:KilA-N domain-containing protein [Verminephrobacter aporrectodeae subsp. tuberculatae]|uniref:KilA-N domain-containing protein n=1 Tax=Verminephrobacter aporrectodeae subsp. tuberculatae TaxID=1110392 RepID=A0ABT3KZF6_9BURK|nr:KilA-N domain-containing protein [Verminephrobacter aporrectodeae]MCW5323723.1 KilA-N domain-containing protein [Verminephrobacter aporrectodeae subsp. tuberculatae]
MTQSARATAPTLAIGGTTVRQIGDLYSLNDLHQAAGGEAKHQPAKFMRLDQTESLIAELGNSPEVASFKTANSTEMQSFAELNSANSRSLETREGRNGGTYACRELVIAYAGWINPAFHLRVIRVFLAQATTPAPTLANRRWLVSYQQGREVVAAVNWDECVLRYEDLPRLIKDGDDAFSAELLTAIGNACFERLSGKVQGLQAIARLRKAPRGEAT